MTKVSNQPGKAHLSPSGPTSEELRAIDDVQLDRSSRVRPPDLKLEYDADTRQLTVQHEGDDISKATALAMHELGSTDLRFFVGIMEQVSALGEQGKSVSETASNFVLSVVGGVRPKDEIETMLALQMGAIHQATMMMARRLNHVDTDPQRDAAERALNKLARTFTYQVEALKKYRAKANQTVRVERVQVTQGGQAIVGNVSKETGGQHEK